MGVSRTSYAIAKSEVVSIYGCRSSALLRRLRAPNDDYTSHLLEGKDEALVDILIGASCAAHSSSDYGYAVMAFCNEFAVYTDSMSDAIGHLIAFADAFDANAVELALLSYQNPILPIPQPDDFPLPFVVENRECMELSGAFADIVARGESSLQPLQSGSDSQRRGLEYVRDVLAMLKKAVELGTDLIMFQH